MAKQVPKKVYDRILRHHVWASIMAALVPVPLADIAALTLIRLNMLRKLAKLYDIPFFDSSGKDMSSSITTVLVSLADDAACVLAGVASPSATTTLAANAGRIVPVVGKAVFVITSVTLPSASTTLAASAAKAVPVIGQTAGVIGMPIVSGAATYAMGKVFIQHFASGGTFLTFNPEKVRNYYAEMFREGEKVAADIQSNKIRKKK